MIKLLNLCLMYCIRKDIFNDALSTFSFWLFDIRHGKGPLSKIGNPLLLQMGYSFLLTARDCLYAPSHRQDIIYHSLCYTSQ